MIDSEKCSNCTEKQACVPFFLHESAMMHKDIDNDRAYKECEKMHKTIRIICLTFLLTIIVFVTGYTIRTRNWLETIASMQTQTAGTEVVNGVQQQPDP